MIDVERMMKIIKDGKYKGYIAIEYLGDDPVGGVKKAAALIKRYG